MKGGREKETEGQRYERGVTSPGLVSGTALAGVGDDERKHSCCPQRLSPCVVAR